MRKLSCKWPVLLTLIALTPPAFSFFFRIIIDPTLFNGEEFAKKVFGGIFFAIIVWLVYGFSCLLAKPAKSGTSDIINAKKELESFYLKKFLEIVGINSLIEQGTEPPDFFIKIKNLNIGVEITEFHSNIKNRKGRCRREVEESWKKLERYMSETIAKDYPRLSNVFAQLCFKELEVPPRPSYPEFARQLFDFLLQNESKFPTDNRSKTVSLVVADAHSTLLNLYLTKIDLFYMPHCDIWTWNRSCAFVGLSEPELLKVIQEKNEK